MMAVVIGCREVQCGPFLELLCANGCGKCSISGTVGSFQFGWEFSSQDLPTVPEWLSKL